MTLFHKNLRRRKETKEIIQKIIWRILRISKIFDYWYDRFLTELLYDLELHRDIEQKEIEEKYRKKLYSLNFLGKYTNLKDKK